MKILPLLRREKKKLATRLAKIEGAISCLNGAHHSHKNGYKLSAAVRHRMSRAQQKRWREAKP